MLSHTTFQRPLTEIRQLLSRPRFFAPAARTFSSSTRLHAKVATAHAQLFDDYVRYMRVRENLEPSSSVVYLEDLLRKYQALFKTSSLDSDRRGSSLRMLYALTQLYAGELLRANRPIATMEFLRNLITIFKSREIFGERLNDSRIINAEVTLYQVLRQFGDNPVERWEIIEDAKKRVEQLSPEAWDEHNMRNLRDERAQILQYYTAEEGELYEDPQSRPQVIARLISHHEEVLRLESGINTPHADATRARSLRAICGFKEERSKDEDYQVYAQELCSSMMKRFKLALTEQDFTCIVAYEALSSHVILCKAYTRAKKWNKVIEVATQGLEIAREINWEEQNRAHVEISQLYVYRSHGYLNSEQPMSALDDAWDAVSEANSIPWLDKHPDEEIRVEYPKEYKKYRWQNFALFNLIDTLFDRQVIQPEEQFGLVQALYGLRTFTSTPVSDPQQDNYEVQYRLKIIRALRRLERWHDALSDCRVLLNKSVQLLPFSDASNLQDMAVLMVMTCEDAGTCLEQLGRQGLSEPLLDEADAFSRFAEDKSLPLESYVERGKRLQEIFEAAYEAATRNPQIAADIKQIEPLKVEHLGGSALTPSGGFLAGLRNIF